MVSPGSAQGPVSGLRLPHPGLGFRVLLCSEWGGAHRRKMGGLSYHPPDLCERLPSPSPDMLTPCRNQGSFMASPSTPTVPQEPRTEAT